MVPSYRLYCFDGAGNITSAEWLDASDDNEAARQARERKLGVVAEIWDRSRLVIRIESTASDDSGS